MYILILKKADLAGLTGCDLKKEIDPEKAAGNAFYRWKRKVELKKKASSGKNKLTGLMKLGALKADPAAEQPDGAPASGENKENSDPSKKDGKDKKGKKGQKGKKGKKGKDKGS